MKLNKISCNRSENQFTNIPLLYNKELQEMKCN